MPITILSPTIDQPFGPGFDFHAISDYLPVPGEGTFWLLEFFELNAELPAFTCRQNWFSQELIITFGEEEDEQWRWFPATPKLIVDGFANLRVQLFENHHGVEQATVPVKVDWQTNAPRIIEQELQNIVPVQGGFGPSDRATLNEIWQAVYKVMTVAAAAEARTP